MDPAHRDRIAFVRVASGHFERGMRLKVVRSGKELRPNTVVSFLSQRRELLDEAFAGDIIGIPNHGVLQLADTLTEGEELQYTGLPFFAPEMFRTVEVADPLRTKQLRAGLTQLGEEGAIQVFRPVAGSVLLLGAVGQLQFEVVAHRLEHEYGVKARIQPSRFQVARWVTCDPADGGDKELQRFIDANQHRVAYDAVDAPTVLVEYAPELRAIESNWPKIKFHALREHAGLVFQRQIDGSARAARAARSSVAAAVAFAVAVTVVLVPALVLAVVVVLVLPAVSHPLLADEVDRLPARVVVAAVATPVALVLLGNVQVHRLLLNDDARWRDDYRLGMPERRRRHVTDRDAAVDAGLVDADRDAGLGGSAAGRGSEEEGENGLHGEHRKRG